MVFVNANLASLFGVEDGFWERFIGNAQGLARASSPDGANTSVAIVVPREEGLGRGGELRGLGLDDRGCEKG
jgi:hypothetical protein